MARRGGALLIATWLLAAPAQIAHPAAAEESALTGELDARIAELEATAVRKGTRPVSLQIYGQVNRAVMVWKDGFDTEASVIDNSTSSSRFGFIGQGKLPAGFVAGYRAEFEVAGTAASEFLSNRPDPASVQLEELGNSPRLRQAYWYVASETAGRLSVGFQSPATDDITLINLGSQMNDAAVHYNSNFSIRLDLAGGIYSDLKWGHIVHNVDSMRGDFVRYDTPSLWGFVLSAAFGENDIWDAALRYQVEAHGFRLAAGVGYMQERENGYSDLKGSASLLHIPTGLYLSVAGGVRDDERSASSTHGRAHFHYLQAGISKRWLPFGATTLYGDFGLYRNFKIGELLQVDPHTGQMVIWGTLSDTEVVRWGFGVEQAVDAAGLLLYAQAHHYDPTIVGFPCDADPARFANQCGGDPTNLVTLPFQPWSAVVVGARLRF